MFHTLTQIAIRVSLAAVVVVGILALSWSRFSDRKVPLNKVETDLLNQGIFTLSA